MSATVANGDAVRRILDLANSQSLYVGLSRTAAWSDEVNPPAAVGDHTETYEFFEECFVIRRVTDQQIVIPDPNTYDVLEVPTYVWLAVPDASAFSDGETVSSGAASGVVVKRCKTGLPDPSGGTMANVGLSDELVIAPVTGTFAEGQTVTGGTSGASATILEAEKRVVHGTELWRPIPVSDVALLVASTPDFSPGDTIQDTANTSTVARVLALKEVTAGNRTLHFIVARPLNGDITQADQIGVSGGASHTVLSTSTRVEVEDATAVRCSAEFDFTTVPTDVSFRRIGVVDGPELTAGTKATGSQYDEKTDNPSGSNWGQNGWYLSKFENPGLLVYVENRSPVSRSADQRETVSVIIRL